jgi:selT/selW/selH-like putative selenoprotein
VEVELIPGGGGVFEVDADGERLHSKRETGRFPDPSSVVAELRRRGAGGG